MYWVRVIGGGSAGLILAAVVFYFAEWLTQGLFGEDGSYFADLVAFALAAITGGALAGGIGGRIPAGVVGVLLALLALTNFLAADHPWWYLPVAIVLVFGGVWLGSKLAPAPDFGHS